MMLSIAFVWLTLSLPPAGTSAQTPAPPQSAPAPLAEELWAATRAGDVARVTAALDKGADVNAKTRYGATALSFAADRGNVELVKLLIARGANVNAQDSFYQMRAINLAMTNNHTAVVTLLLERGSLGAPAVLAQAVQRGSMPIVAAALASSELTRVQVGNALAGARKANNPEILALIEKKLAGMPAEETAAAASSAAAAPPPPPPVAAAAPIAPLPADTKPATRTAARNWPGFRGDNAAGNGDGQGAVVEWDVETQQNIRWKTAIPGISNASPVVWGNRVFVVTAVSSAGDKTFRTGLYGDVAPA